VSTHRFVEHGGEVEIELESPTEAGLFAAALDAFAELVSAEGEGSSARHEIELAGDDRALLLVDWLSELVYLTEVEQFVPERLASFELAGGRLRATVAGRRDDPAHLVKAVTLNELEFAERGGSWHGRVVLDV
jgi:SHS2 domain-containing protein